MKEKSFLQMQAYDSIKNGILNGELEPGQQKFCSARKLPVAGCPRNAWKNCIKSPIEMEPRNASGVPGLQIYSYLSG